MKLLQLLLLPILMLPLSIVGQTATKPILVSVLDTTETEGVANVFLLISSVQSHKVRAYVTDSDGRVFVEPMNGAFCTVTAFDPAGLFYSKTTEFDCHSSPVTLILAVRPIIDKISISNFVKLKIVIYGPDGKVLPRQSIIFRPSTMTLETTRVFLEATDDNGMIDAQLSEGEHTLATLIEGKPFEGALLVVAKKQKCPSTSQNCFHLSDDSYTAKPFVVHLVFSATTAGGAGLATKVWVPNP